MESGGCREGCEGFRLKNKSETSRGALKGGPIRPCPPWASLGGWWRLLLVLGFAEELKKPRHTKLAATSSKQTQTWTHDCHFLHLFSRIPL